ncbi:MAG TPA: hypothetical protein VM425_10730 [Myxococcota bacterium]|nr:hypothetical protein [Myxococcota bacterium]
MTGPYGRWFLSLGLLFASAMACGCAREPLDVVCTPMSAGDLAFSELRGGQNGADSFGQWVELYNASASELNLAGLVLDIKMLSGGGEHEIAVRRPLTVSAGGYVVLGRFTDDPLERPEYIDYGFEDDYSGDLYTDAILEARSCGEVIDHLVYHDLPTAGTLGFNGGLELSAAANDNESDWCIDDTPYNPGDGGTTQVGIPGTPGQRNKTCE